MSRRQVSKAKTWLASDDRDTLLSLAAARTSPRKRYLFGAACCRRLGHLLDDRHFEAIAAAERFADGEISADDLEAANAAAFHGWEQLRVDCGPTEDPDEPGYWETNTGRAAGYSADATHFLTLADARGIGGVVMRCSEAVFWADRANADAEQAAHTALIRCVFGNPFRPVPFDPAWRTETAVGIARTAYDARGFGNLPVLADALQDAGCEQPEILAHLRGDGPHARGCWAVDLVLGLA